MSQVMINPPVKNPITATREGNCIFAIPEIACPEVQPPAYLAPNPTRKPPTTITINPLSENKDFQEYRSQNSGDSYTKN